MKMMISSSEALRSSYSPANLAEASSEIYDGGGKWRMVEVGKLASAGDFECFHVGSPFSASPPSQRTLP